MSERTLNVTTIACYALTFLATQANMIVVFASDLDTTSMLCASAGIFVITSALITILGAIDVLIPHLAAPRLKGASPLDAIPDEVREINPTNSGASATSEVTSSNPMPFEHEQPGVVY